MVSSGYRLKYLRGTIHGKCGLVNPQAKKKGSRRGFWISEIAQLATLPSKHLVISQVDFFPKGVHAVSGKIHVTLWDLLLSCFESERNIHPTISDRRRLSHEIFLPHPRTP